jgi:hypothetical protein
MFSSNSILLAQYHTEMTFRAAVIMDVRLGGDGREIREEDHVLWIRVYPAAVKNGYVGLAVLGVLNSAVSVYYYLRPVARDPAMIFPQKAGGAKRGGHDTPPLLLIRRRPGPESVGFHRVDGQGRSICPRIAPTVNTMLWML